ncbi:MAG: multiprotein-bridging factor 1 family protein [Candidatus Micrarchaeota archaeon]|nr:multiprotein-bridging factor 1 family protein [Candidatus Micrarchaeota archaeon]
MGDCEVCGAKKAVKAAIIEGVRLEVCVDCARLGKVIENPAVAIQKPKTGGVSGSAAHRRDKKAALESSREEIVEDYAEILRKQISRIGISYSQLARSIDENESYLKRVVHGDTLPTLKLAKKLEKALNVKITEIPEEK